MKTRTERLLTLTRQEAIALVNTATLAVKHLPPMPKNFTKRLDSGVQKVMKAWRLDRCPCCDLVDEGSGAK